MRSLEFFTLFCGVIFSFDFYVFEHLRHRQPPIRTQQRRQFCSFNFYFIVRCLFGFSCKLGVVFFFPLLLGPERSQANEQHFDNLNPTKFSVNFETFFCCCRITIHKPTNLTCKLSKTLVFSPAYYRLYYDSCSQRLLFYFSLVFFSFCINTRTRESWRRMKLNKTPSTDEMCQ